LPAFLISAQGENKNVSGFYESTKPPRPSPPMVASNRATIGGRGNAQISIAQSSFRSSVLNLLPNFLFALGPGTGHRSKTSKNVPRKTANYSPYVVWRSERFCSPAPSQNITTFLAAFFFLALSSMSLQLLSCVLFSSFFPLSNLSSTSQTINLSCPFLFPQDVLDLV